jgi:hypothetical protein
MMYARGRLLMLGWLVSARAGLPGKRRTRREARVSTVKSRIPFGPAPSSPVHSTLRFRNTSYSHFLTYALTASPARRASSLQPLATHPVPMQDLGSSCQHIPPPLRRPETQR